MWSSGDKKLPACLCDFQWLPGKLFIMWLFTIFAASLVGVIEDKVEEVRQPRRSQVPFLLQLHRVLPDVLNDGQCSSSDLAQVVCEVSISALVTWIFCLSSKISTWLQMYDFLRVVSTICCLDPCGITGRICFQSPATCCISSHVARTCPSTHTSTCGSMMSRSALCMSFLVASHLVKWQADSSLMLIGVKNFSELILTQL